MSEDQKEETLKKLSKEPFMKTRKGCKEAGFCCCSNENH